MLRRILNFLKSKAKENPFDQGYKYKEFIDIASNVRFESLKLEIRKPVTGKKFFTVGSGSVISGNFVFENENGRINIGENTFIGGGQFISIEGIEIGSNVLFSWNCTVIDNDAHSLNANDRVNDVRDWKKGLDENQIGKYKNWRNVKSGKILIKDRAWIGFNSVILKGVTIGEGAIVGAGSIVTSDVPDYSVVAGNPAKVIKTME